MRKVADCRLMPSESGCSLLLSGSEEEVVLAATEHAVRVHGHADGAELREAVRRSLHDEDPGSALLRAGYDAFARGDVPAVVDLLDPQITWTTPASVPIGGTYHGREGVAEFFGRLAEVWADLSVVAERFVERGDTVVVLGRHRGRTMAGRSVDTPFCHVWTIAGGRAVAFSELVDTAELNLAIGVPVQRPSQPAGSRTRA